jgi:hypothetical protein
MALTVPFATADDLAARWRPLSAEEEARADILLGDASQLILDEDKVGILDALEDPPSLTLVRIVCAMVRRAMMSGGDSASQTQQAAGPFSISTTFANPGGDLYLTSAERRAIGFSSQRAGSVDMFEIADPTFP